VKNVATVWQGEFKNDFLHGYGRKMTIHFGEKALVTEQIIGMWSEGFLHGFSKVTYPSGEVTEGLFEDGHKRWEISEITSYDPKNDKIAQKIDFDKHFVKDNFGPPPAKKAAKKEAKAPR